MLRNNQEIAGLGLYHYEGLGKVEGTLRGQTVKGKRWLETEAKSERKLLIQNGYPVSVIFIYLSG
ncbi:MAG: hypothetical protein PHY99_09340 [Bacteroidales bacterium]|nr:hypothetical protein [Bacteroidales bacterium]